MQIKHNFNEQFRNICLTICSPCDYCVLRHYDMHSSHSYSVTLHYTHTHARTHARAHARMHARTHAHMHTHTSSVLKLSTKVCLSVLSNCRSQFLIERFGKCLKLFVSTDSTSCHEFASQFGLAIFLYAKNIQNLGEIGLPARVFT